MRILLINPNTSPEITELVAQHARRAVGPEVEFVCATGRFGARYISSRASAAIAAHAALDAVAEHVDGCDAVFLACFGDPGLAALKELSPVPVVGMAEAACHAAATRGTRFSIVTGGARWRPMLEEFVAQLGLRERLASVRCLARTGAEIARDRDGSVGALAQECRSAAETDGAAVVILGGAALAGLAPAIAEQVTVPVLCSVEVGARAVVAAAAAPPQGTEKAKVAETPSVGLSERLARALK
jgi:allantoin racemase